MPSALIGSQTANRFVMCLCARGVECGPEPLIQFSEEFYEELRRFAHKTDSMRQNFFHRRVSTITKNGLELKTLAIDSSSHSYNCDDSDHDIRYFSVSVLAPWSVRITRFFGCVRSIPSLIMVQLFHKTTAYLT